MRSIPVLCFVGSSNSGKTTLIEKVIRQLSVKGYRVASIKHTHKGFEMDREGKDSWKHRQAGAKTVILSSPTGFAVISDTDRELTMEEILERFMNDVDIVIVEGFKKDKFPKIEVRRGSIPVEKRWLNDPSIVAIASDESIVAEIPGFEINDSEGISSFIEKKYLENLTSNKIGGDHDGY